MLIKTRKLILLILTFILGILSVTYWLGYTSNLTIPILLVESGQQAHATGMPTVKSKVGQGNQHVHTSFIPILSIHERLDPITVAFGGSVHVPVSHVQLGAITQSFRSSDVQFRAGTTYMRASTVQIRASATRDHQDRAKSSKVGAGLIQTHLNKTRIGARTQTRKINSEFSSVYWTSYNHSEPKTFRKTPILQDASHSSTIDPKSTHAWKTMPPEKMMPHDKDHQHTCVVILAHGRSGSSFLGGIFNVHPDVFFIYEPLLTLLKFTNQSSNGYLNKVEEILHSIFNCNFTDGLYLKYLSKFERKRAASRPLVSPPFCNVSHQLAIDFTENRKWRRCVRNISAHALNSMCRSKGHVVLKILVPRLNNVDISWLLHVRSTSSFPVHILYLVRDPRAMHFSQYTLGWIAPLPERKDSLENGLADRKVKRSCDTTEQYLREISRYTDAIQLLRYEDLATNPEAFVRKLFSSLGLSLSEEVSQWLKEKNHTAKKQNYFSLSRESKTAISSWRKNIPTKLVRIVETRCKHIMKYLGYLPTNGLLTLLHDLQNPLFSKQWGNESFTAADRGELRKH